MGVFGEVLHSIEFGNMEQYFNGISVYKPLATVCIQNR